MRVALIGPVPPQFGGPTPGGVSTHHIHLASGLAAAGVCAPLLATNTRTCPRSSRAADDFAPFPLYRMAHPGWTRRDYLSTVGYGRVVDYVRRTAFTRPQGSRREVLANLLWYRHFLAEVRPDLVHVQHSLERCLYVRMVREFERWDLPLVVTAHSLFGEHSDETIYGLMAPNLRAADRVIAVSEHIAKQAIELGVDPNRVRVVRSGVDTTLFRPRERLDARKGLGLPGYVALVLFVGNLEPRKQIDVLLRAMVRVRQQQPDSVLLVVGSGENAGALDQTTFLTHLSRELALEGTTRFTGHVSDEELLQYYTAADIFVLPSSSEAQGIVALEAMACGLPVVATAVGGLRGTIQDGETGVLVPSGDVEQLAKQITDLLSDSTRRAAIGAAARKAVERNFSWARSIEATIAVYSEITQVRKLA